MTLAVDTSALLAIFNAEADASAWIDVLAAARRDGDLVVCEAVYAEAAARGFAQEVDAEVSDPLTLALSLREREFRHCTECMADESLSRRERAG